MLLTVCFLQVYNVKLQSFILLMLSGIYLLVTHSKQPFMRKKENNLENSSNISSFCIVLVYNLLLTDIQENFKNLLIILLLFISNLFLIIWIGSTFDIFFMNHLRFFKLKLPRFYKFYIGTKMLVSHFSSKKSIFIPETFRQDFIEDQPKIKDNGIKAKKNVKKFLNFLIEL